MKMILDERGKKYILKPGAEFQSDLGIVKADVLDNAQIGDEVKSHLDHSFKIVKPNVNDFIDLMERRCSILIKKDIGQVLAHTGLGAGSRVVDAGTGAGAIALHFGNVVGLEGKVFTYEVREDFAEVARRNIDNFGITNIEVKNKNIKELSRQILNDAYRRIFLKETLRVPVLRDSQTQCSESVSTAGLLALSGSGLLKEYTLICVKYKMRHSHLFVFFL